MAKMTPILIRYKDYEIEKDAVVIDKNKNPAQELDDVCSQSDFGKADRHVNEIRFHAVVSEDHSASTKITKFP
ncbi:MAG: hypothetical protein DRJ15_17285, partial [Bacteroidetes bacterium]